MESISLLVYLVVDLRQVALVVVEVVPLQWLRHHEGRTLAAAVVALTARALVLVVVVTVVAMAVEAAMMATAVEAAMIHQDMMRQATVAVAMMLHRLATAAVVAMTQHRLVTAVAVALTPRLAMAVAVMTLQATVVVVTMQRRLAMVAVVVMMRHQATVAEAVAVALAAARTRFNLYLFDELLKFVDCFCDPLIVNASLLI